MATPGFDEEAAERWMQTRSTARHADPNDPMARFRNQSRSMFVDSKNYTGGALRGAVSDRRAEWMGGGAGGRMGEDWRNHQMIDVDRHGSGLDPFSYAIAKKVRGGVDRRRLKRAARQGMVVDSEESTVEPEEPTTPVEPAKAKRTMTPEQRAKANERRRALTAERKEAVQKVGTMGDWSGSGVLMTGETPSLWGNAPEP